MQLLGSQGLWQWLSSQMPCVHSDESQAQTQTWCDRAAGSRVLACPLLWALPRSPCYGLSLVKRQTWEVRECWGACGVGVEPVGGRSRVLEEVHRGTVGGPLADVSLLPHSGSQSSPSDPDSQHVCFLFGPRSKPLATCFQMSEN